MKIVLYSSEYKYELERLLKCFSSEVFNTGTVDIDSFIGCHWAIYLAISDGKVIGFSSFIINTYFGLRSSTLGNTYVFFCFDI